MSITWQTVHVRINDAATGKPTPARLRITDAEGRYYPPLGRLAEFATGRNQDVGGNLLLGRKPHAYIDGTCEVPLPAGQLLVEVGKGPEYRPLRQEVVLSPGQLALRLTLKRWANLRDEGWYSGDCRAFFLIPHGALLEGAAEDLAVVNLLAAEDRIPGPEGKVFRSVPNLLAFSGQVPSLERPGHLVAVNTHNTHPVLGSLALLNCHRVVYPLSFGGPGGWDNWSLADWCDQCHRKGGLVVWTRSETERADLSYGEPLADLVLGKVDAFEIDFFEDSPFDRLPDWYALLNAGLRVPLVGSSGKESNGTALGAMRTYARLRPGEALTYKNWVEAVRAGRTFVTNGPLLTFTLNGQEPGAAIRQADGTETVRVRAEARSLVPFDRLEVVANGEVVAAAGAAGEPSAAVLEAEIALPESGWVAARCQGAALLPQRPAPQRVFAHSSPVYVEREDRPFPPDPRAQAALLGHLDALQEWARTQARCENDRQRERLVAIFLEAREQLAAVP